MSPKRNIGKELIEGMEEAVEYMRGKKTRVVTHKVKIPDKIDVRSIRKNLNLSRPEFADRYGFSKRTLQHWEQGNRRPQGAAKVLLLLLQREPETIEKILHQESIGIISNLRSQKVAHKRKSGKPPA